MKLAEKKEQKRIEAQARAKFYTYENSKAKRLGTRTEEEWKERNKQFC